MNRRNVLIGLGTAAAGSSAVFGSGAFTQVQADRDITFNIDADDSALITLTDQSPTNLIQQSNNTLTIDTTEIASGSQGFNTDSLIEIGSIDTSGTNDTIGTTAFQIDSNLNTTDNTNLNVAIQLTGGDTSSKDVTLYLDGDAGNDSSDTLKSATTGDGTEVSIDFGFDDSSSDDNSQTDFDTDAPIGGAIQIDLTGTTSIDNYGGSGGELTLTTTTESSS